ncbi:arsenite efflux ATP-binding protein ArsA [Jatrophihabitans sp. GAS493]|uniref:ArsA family ATPase n=1 Tax=Jatrophihabitans sp. GAS493 TaxID=1907575 RepID=UPI000BC06DB2|nr:ArsA family ATPase [Jatrophihabitans sp. GAS493]SOD74377.1 arsenite efflux ATP-binding protein ArsA [Jatrophihabitans sp. GAS493]
MAEMRIVLLTGKGGVGKTTVAASTALRCAARGVKTLLLSTDAAHSLADTLDVELGGEPVEVTENLWSVQIDTQRRFEAAWADVQRYLLEVLSRGGVDPITAQELTVLPGIDEVLALLAVHDLASSGSWDVLIVDCAPTAETLRLLALPEALGWYLQKVFPVQRRLARGIRPLAAILGRGDALPPDDLFDALLRLNDDLALVRGMLADPDVTSVRLVLTPEAVVLAETRRTFTALALYGYNVDMVVANKLFPEGEDAFRQGWVVAQRRQMGLIEESFAGLPIKQITYRGGEPVGVPALSEVADELYGSLAGAESLDPVSVADPAVDGIAPLMSVEAVGAQFLLRLRLPLVSRAVVDAARVGDELVLTVAGNRRILTLPSVLRRCSVVSGEVADGELRVYFEPDPATWPQPQPQPHTQPQSRATATENGADAPADGETADE